MSPISAADVRPSRIYTSSYDCTIRSLNFETGVWREEVDIDLFSAATEGEGEALTSAFELTHDGNLIWGAPSPLSIKSHRLTALCSI